MKITAENIHLDLLRASGGSLILGAGLTAIIKTPLDDCEAPWEWSDGHGPVSEWTCRDKKAGERIVAKDRNLRRYYDYAEATVIAKRDGWGITDAARAKLIAKLGRAPTKKEIVAASVDSDFEFLRSWCADEWRYIGVEVTLAHNGKEVGSDALWRIENNTNYWREVAAEMVNNLVAAHEKEEAEKAEWAARDTITIV